MVKIARQSLAEDVYDRLQRDIVSGVLVPDAPIRQDTLADALGVSKIPVREALTRLEEVGFVVSHPRRGYVVRGLDLAEAREIFGLRMLLEPPLVALAAASAGAEDHARAVARLAALEAEVRSAGHDAGARNRDFHEALAAPAARPLTLGIVMRLHALAERYVNLHLVPEGRGARAEAEHRELLAAWIGGDVARTEWVLARHIGRTLADLEAEMRT